MTISGPTLSADDFEAALVETIPQMRAFARALCGGDQAAADDLAQDALLKAWRRRDQFAAGTNLRAWTFTIVRNTFLSSLRANRRFTALDPEVAERTLVAADDPQAGVELDDVLRALAHLPEEQREALILVTAGGLGYEEAAEVMQTAVGTVKSRVSRARERVLRLVDSSGALGAASAGPEVARTIERLRRRGGG